MTDENRNELLTDVALDAFTTGDVVAYFEKRSPEVKGARRAIIKLIGPDSSRVLALASALSLSTRYENLEERFDVDFVQALNKLTKREAFRLYATFPRLLAPNRALPDCPEEAEEMKATGRFYTGVGMWLLNWNKGGHHTKVLGELGLDEEEKRAWVSRFRFQLCDYLTRHDKSPYISSLNSAALWLLVEISICRNRLEDKPKEGSKRKRYERMQKLFARLDSGDPADLPRDRQVKDIADLVENFNGFFLHRVSVMADERPDFDKVLYKQYLQAEKAWGRKALSAKGTQAYL